MKTLLKSQTNTVISVLGFKLWIAKGEKSNCSNVIGLFGYAIQYDQKSINVGLRYGFIK